MLSHPDVDARVSDGRLRIWYAFVPTGQNSTCEYHQPALLVDLADASNAATGFYHRNRYSTHLHLTAGPIIQTHRRWRVGGRTPFPHYPDCFDLRKRNEIVFEPFETLTILTNEQMALDGRTAALVTPRVTNSDSGLIVATAYIDPFYNGIMRIVVSNITPKRQTLRVGEPIAQCFFFDLSTAIDEGFRQAFAQKTKFYGHTWERVLTGDGDPFPRNKKPKPDRSWLDTLKRRVLPHLTLRKVLAFMTAGAGAAYIIPFLVTFYTAVMGYPALRVHVDDLGTKAAEANKSIPQTGNATVVIAAGTKEGHVQLPYPIASLPAPHIWLSIDRAATTVPDSVDLSYSLSPSGPSGNSVVDVIARTRGVPATVDTRVPVLWMVTRGVP